MATRFLRLVGFRIHQALEIQFKPGLTLIKGDNGTGKTAIFMAVEWLLYGGRTPVVPYNATKSQLTAVAFQWDNIYIYREKQPHSRLIVKTPEREYLDAQAQAYIDQVYDPWDNWVLANYLPQGALCHLLTVPRKEQMRLLNYLAFKQEDPELKITELTRQCDSIRAQFEQARAGYLAKHEHLLREQNEHKYERSWLLTDEAAVIKAITVAEAELPQLEQQLLIAERQRAVREHLAQQLAKVQARNVQPPAGEKPTELADGLPALEQAVRLAEHQLEQRKLVLNQIQVHQSNIPEPVNVDLATLTQEYTRLKQAQQRLPLVAELQQLRAALAGKVDTNPNVSWETIALARQQEQQHATLLNMCERYQLKPEQLADRKLLLSNLLEQQALVPLCQRYQQICEHLSKLPTEQISDEALREADEGRRLLKCPGCQCSLSFTSGQLTKASKPAISESEYNHIHSLYLSTQQVKQLKAERDNLKLSLPTTLVSPDSKASNWRQELADLQSVSAAARAPVVSSLELQAQQLLSQQFKRLAELNLLLAGTQEMDESLTATIIAERLQQIAVSYNARTLRDAWTAKQEELNRVLAALPEPSLTILPERMTELREWDRQQRVYQAWQDEQVAAQRALAAEPEPLPIQLIDVAARRQRLAADRTALQRHQTYSRWAGQVNQLNQQAASIEQLQRDVAAYHDLKALAVEVEYETLQSIIDTINIRVSGVLSKLFTEPMLCQLAAFRELKSGNTKPQVNLRIKYKGAEYDDHRQLSGGELARVSLSLLLGFASRSRFPLLMLDEPMAALSSTMKDNCLRQLKRESVSRCILVIAHDTYEMCYDQVVDLNDQK